MFALGWPFMAMIERKTSRFSSGVRLFAPFFLGYWVFISLNAIIVARFATVQWLNLLPFLSLFFWPSAKQSAKVNFSAKDGSTLVFSALFLAFSVWYFVCSYSSNYQLLDHVPFIDTVSYACSAFGMGYARAENSFFDLALYYPQKSSFNLYHFTELWFTQGLSDLLGKPPLWIICLVVPPCLLTLLVLGIFAALENSSLPSWARFFLVLSLCFANAKLLFFSDNFLLNLMDLGGLKIAVLIPLFLWLWLLRSHRFLFILFALWLPQANVLMLPFLAVSFGILLIFKKLSFQDFFNKKVFWAYFLYGLGLAVIVGIGGTGPAGKAHQDFSLPIVLDRTVIYIREAFFNLGFYYYGLFLALAALAVSPRYFWLLFPPLAAKGFSKLVGYFWPLLSNSFHAGLEVGFALLLLLILQLRFKVLPKWMFMGAATLAILCLVAAVGYSTTGFMDYEQIFTIATASLFFVFIVLIFSETWQVGPAPIFSFRGQWANGLAVSAISLGLLSYTFRFQRSLPFDPDYQAKISKDLAQLPEPKLSAYLTKRRFSPFPLHIKAGFPQLFVYGSAISTAVTMMEDDSWVETDIEHHVTNYPFYLYNLHDTRWMKEKGFQAQRRRFYKQFNIHTLWIDNHFPDDEIGIPDSAVIARHQSPRDTIRCWIIDPQKL